MRKKYSQKYKEEVSSLVIYQGRDVRELSEELNIPERVILKWVKGYEKELAELNAKLERSEEEKKYLEKEVAIRSMVLEALMRHNK